MNKPLIAAIGGVVFGVTLCASVLHLRMHSRHSHCHNRQAMLMYQPAKLLPPPVSFQPAPAPTPVSCPEQDDMSRQSSDQWLSVAQTEYVNGRYDCAMQLARSEVPNNPERAYRVVGAAACQSGNLPVATDSYRHLSSAARQYLIYTCQRQGISWKNRHFVKE